MSIKLTKRLIVHRRKTASFDVDPQRGFTSLCPSELPVPGGEQIVSELNLMSLAASLRLVSRDWHPAEAAWNATKENGMFSPVGLANVDVRWNSHCVAGTLGAELLPGLPRLLDYDFVASKGLDPDCHPYGACYHDLADSRSTGAIEFLRDRRIQTVIVGGLATDYCVKKTCQQLLAAGFRVVLNLAACRGINDGTTLDALETLQAAGVIMIANSAALDSVS